MGKKDSMPMAAAPEKNKDGGDNDYEADDALRTIERYHEHRANPDLMKRVKKKAGRKLKSLAALHNDIRSIDDIRAYREDKYGASAKKKPDPFGVDE